MLLLVIEELRYTKYWLIKGKYVSDLEIHRSILGRRNQSWILFRVKHFECKKENVYHNLKSEKNW